MATQLFFRHANSDLQGAGQKMLSLVRGPVVRTAITTATASGDNINITQTAGGQALSWLTPPLAAGITISGTVTPNIRGLESVATVNGGAGIRIERCNNAGVVQSAIVANSAVTATEWGTTEAARTVGIAPTSTALVAGERIKVTLLLKAAPAPMAAGTATYQYDGPTAAATGDAFVTFTENLTFQTFVPPTPVGTAQQIASGLGARSFAAETPALGDWIIVQLDSEAGGVDFTCTATGLTFALINTVTDASPGTRNELFQWAAREPTGGIARTVNIAAGSGLRYTARLAVLRGSSGPGAFAAAAQGQTVSFSRAYNDSRIQYNIGDWSANAVVTPVWTPSGPVTSYTEQDPSHATHYYGSWADSGAAAAPAAHGISSPAITTPSVAVMEMYGAPSTTTPVSQTVDLRWRSMAQVTQTVDLRWRSMARVTQTLDLRWKSYTAVAATTLDLRWKSYARVSQTIDLRWKSLAQVAQTLDLRWRSAAQVAQTLDLRWKSYVQVAATTLDLRWKSLASATQVTQTLDLRWKSAAQVTQTIDLRWRSLARVTQTIDLPWRSLAQVIQTVDLRWRSAARVTQTLDLRWKSSVTVSQTVDLRWKNYVAVAPTTLDLRWKNLARVIQTLDLRWKSYAPVAPTSLDLRWKNYVAVAPTSLDLRWRSMAQVVQTLDLRWKTLSSAVQVTQTLDLRWRSAAQVTQTIDLRWRNAFKVTTTLDLRWKSYAPVVPTTLDLRWKSYAPVAPTTLDLRWKSYVTISQTVDLRWRTRSLVAATLDLRWRSGAGVTATLDLRWRTYTRVNTDIQFLWRPRVRVTQTLDLRWKTTGGVVATLTLLWRSFGTSRIISEPPITVELLDTAIRSDRLVIEGDADVRPPVLANRRPIEAWIVNR